MKKLLALVLALVMTLSLCVTSNAAFSDAKDVNYTDAVDVLTAVGVFKGYEDGSFKPTKTLTRAEATKLIAYLDLGEKAADALEGSGKVFSDVPASHWAAGYIEYCAAVGYVAGVGDGKFDPNGELTSVAYGKMLMCALGYDADYEGFNGSNWSIKIVKKANDLEIFDGVEKSVNAAITREEAAQYTLNTLNCVMVTANPGVTTYVGNIPVTSGGSAAELNQANVGSKAYADNFGDAPVSGSTYYVQLGEYRFNYLYKAADNDDFGRTSYTYWFDADKDGVEDDGETICTTVSKAAAKKLVLAKDYSNTSNYASLAAIVNAIEDPKDDYTLAGALEVWFNGDKVCNNGTWTSTNYAGTLASAMKAGATVEFWLTTNSNTEISKVVAYAYSTAVVSSNPNANVTDSDKKDGVSYYTSFAGATKDTDIPGFDAATYVKDAVVAYCATSGGTIIDSYIPTAVTGAMKAYTGESVATFTKVNIDGTQYTAAGTIVNNLTVANFKDGAYTIYNDKNGYVLRADVATEAAAKLEDVVFVVDNYVTANTAYGTNAGYNIYAQVVDINDGTVDNVLIGTTGAKAPGTIATAGTYVQVSNGQVTNHAAKAVGDSITGSWYLLSGAYEVADGYYSYADVADKDYKAFTAFATTSAYNVDLNGSFTNAITKKTTKLDGKYITADTKFVLVENSLNDIDVKTYTGPIALAVTYQTNMAFISAIDANDNNVATYVVVTMTDNTLDSSSSTELFFCADNSKNVVENGYAYTLYNTKGEAVTLVCSNSSLLEDTFYEVSSVSSKDVYTLAPGTELLEGAIAASGFEAGFVTNLTLDTRYGTKINATNGTSANEDLDDVEAANMKVIDVRTATEKKADKYTGTINSIETLFTAKDVATTVNGCAYVTDDGVQLFFVTAVANA